jgi:hypothetical protein
MQGKEIVNLKSGRSVGGLPAHIAGCEAIERGPLPVPRWENLAKKSGTGKPKLWMGYGDRGETLKNHLSK